MRRHVFLFAGILLLSASASAQVYKCEGPEGVRYSDSPCGENAERITIPDNRIGGSFNSNLPPQPEPATEQAQPEERAASSNPPSPCKFINSTDLRRYIIREQVVKGMTKDNVLDAFGRPPETYPTPQETWVYSTDYYGMLYELTYVYFRDGCVEKVVYRKP
ncbi:DUF4124 domain-containing protein [Marinobacter sp. BGYM27]|uniref:DUF4124 domain-containing protein n=1 Tax=unclassified Marinobacter TaxID=83889 RepID=UPI0021A602ED|nr:DUF4124 domain-containing protein [Marinobacter sp. BGYM27]MDG5501485.1 DUF4124 domain-containing protein [Marinobacter sp. BGYM27]|tara:strand:+ start:59801 stop:60286 length:486 start_codon:yes stop_codon:yes gene_type:complete